MKQEGISFQSPYTKLRVHWEDVMTVNESAAAAACEIQQRVHKKKTPAKTWGLDGGRGDRIGTGADGRGSDGREGKTEEGSGGEMAASFEEADGRE